MDAVVNYIQLVANLSALVVIGWIYAAYIKNLRATIELKDVQIETVERSLSHLRQRNEDLEKRTPEHIEHVLAERIRIREDEVQRLTKDRERHTEEIMTRTRELGNLRLELQKAKDIGRSIVTYDPKINDEVVVPTSELELVHMGEVAVDSASLVITDPCYINSEWHQEAYDASRSRYLDHETSRVYEMNVDFKHYDTKLEPLGMSINQALQSGRVTEIKGEADPEKFTMSLNGTQHATNTPDRYGVLRFTNGNEGAGIAFATVYGDGVYRVYGDKYEGRIVRVYIDLQ